jgi:hypothetical protein
MGQQQSTEGSGCGHESEVFLSINETSKEDGVFRFLFLTSQRGFSSILLSDLQIGVLMLRVMFHTKPFSYP